MAEPVRVKEVKQQAHIRLQAFHRARQAGRLALEQVNEWAADAATDLMACRPLVCAEALRLLCEIATLDDETLAAPGLNALFRDVVEPLSDSFEPSDCASYYAIFAHVIEFCRQLPQQQKLNRQLNQFGLQSTRDLNQRMQTVRQIKPCDPARTGRIKRAFILSRVTLGADVEITSIIWQKLRQLMPSAEIILLGSEKANELFGGSASLRIHRLDYHRGSSLLERLASWIAVVETIKELATGLSHDEFLIVDPDSRLTQLGLLPLAQDERHSYFFESRSYQKDGLSGLSQLAATWADETFGEGQRLYPCVWLRRDDVVFGKTVVERIRAKRPRDLITLSLGVGGNPRKCLNESFELELVSRLLQTGAALVVDKGVGAQEVQRVDSIIRAVCQQGRRVIELDERNASARVALDDLDADLFTWHGGIGRFSALVAHSDQYIGYDSAGQHIAAALGIPTTVIFAGYPSRRFVERWTPGGPAPVNILCVESAWSVASLVDDVLRAVDQMRVHRPRQTLVQL
ncbi:MAG: hypothetical protein RMM98_09480 [Acidobacteriota bacterium]|nr:hypothetical protein [Blastocatellia bacterium]MDW8239836.1 hypothetical protein [Acidobacteriota bacterium]